MHERLSEIEKRCAALVAELAVISQAERCGENWLGFVFLVDAFTGEVPQRNDDGPLQWVPIDRLLGRGQPLPMWPGDRHFLPLVFDADPRPFHGVMPYRGGEPVSWSFNR